MALIISATVAVAFPGSGADWDIIGVVADNIYHGHGVSVSLTPPYKPHFGGNAFPGYPFFSALCWWIFGRSETAIRLMQCLIFAVCTAFFSYALVQSISRSKVGILTGYMIALSPLTISWHRNLHPQGMSISLGMMVFSWLFLALSRGKIRVFVIGLSIVLAVYFRTDNVFFCFPVLAIMLVPEKSRIKLFLSGLGIAGIVFLGVGGWFVRCWTVGMQNPYPSYLVPYDKEMNPYPVPTGYVLWGLTWMSTEYQRAGWGFPIAVSGYDSIYIPEVAYYSEPEKEKILSLLKELKTYANGVFPSHIDDEFMALALTRMRENPLHVFLLLPLKRLTALWIHPGSSYGWPFEMSYLSYEERLAIESSPFSGALQMLRRDIVRFSGKVSLFALTCLLYVLASMGVIGLYRDRKTRPTAVCSLLFIFSTSVFYAWSNNVEPRYMTQSMPLLHFFAASYFASRRSDQQST